MMLASKIQLSATRLSVRLRPLLESDAARGAAVSATLTGLAAVASFGMLTVLARSMPESDFGLIAGWMNTLLFLSVVSVFGQETMFVRSWNEFVHAGRFDCARGILLFGAGMSLLGCSVVSVCLIGASWYLGLDRELVVGLVLFLLAQTLCLFSSQTARITAGMAAGVLHREITWRVLILLAVAWFIYAGAGFTSLAFFYIAASGIMLATILQVRSTIAALPREVVGASAQMEAPRWLKRSFRMWLAALLEAASQYLDVVIIAVFLSPRDAAIYFICLKLASIFLMLGDAFGLYSSRQISFLYHRSDHRSLQSMLKQLSGLMLCLCLPGFLGVSAGGSLLLQIFGAPYVDQHAILVVLCIGTVAVALGGPVTHVLLLTGHETAYIRTLAAMTLLRYASIACLGWFAGLLGAVVANAACMVILTLVLIFLCRRLVGVDPSALVLAGAKVRRG
jgi:O-antigen/teichoic acid export membrane protein